MWEHYQLLQVPNFAYCHKCGKSVWFQPNLTRLWQYFLSTRFWDHSYQRGCCLKTRSFFPRQLDYFSVINEREERFEVLVTARFRIVHPCWAATRPFAAAAGAPNCSAAQKAENPQGCESSKSWKQMSTAFMVSVRVRFCDLWPYTRQIFGFQRSDSELYLSMIGNTRTRTQVATESGTLYRQRLFVFWYFLLCRWQV